MTPRLRAYLLLTITALLWGCNTVAGKMAVGHISPMLLTSSRWGMALMVLLTFALPQIRRDWPIIKKHLPLLIAYGALGFTGFNIVLYSSLQYTTAIHVAIIQSGVPMMIFFANFLFFRIKAGIMQMLGFVLTLCGVAIVASSGNLTLLLELELNRGDALMLLAMLLYSGYAVALRYKPAIHWQSMISVLAIAAFVTSLPFTALEISRESITWPDTRGWMIAIFAAIFPSLISQVLFIRGTEMIGSNRAGLFINLVPIFGTLLSILILHETLHPYHVLALVLVFSGIWFAERGKQTT